MTIPSDTPFPRSYWVIPVKLLAGCYPGSTEPDVAHTNLERLLGCGIRLIINLMEEDEMNWDGTPFVPYQEPFCTMAAGMGLSASCVRMPIKDVDVPSRQGMKSILDEIDRSLAQDHPVYIHCWGGRGRTGTVVGCYLARHGMATGKQALQKIQQLRYAVPDALKSSPDTDTQGAMITSWKQGE